ncbi:MAG: DNA topoisomerase IB [Saprospiraceae bacterium]
MALVHVTGDSAGFRRKGRGKGFEYLDDKGQRVTDKENLDRIKALRIPPAWKNVWICKNPNGHLQATGIDARGRKQYLYHEEWNKQSHLNKFDRMAGFAKALPGIRKKIQNDLKKEGWPREKVISLVLNILDHTALRIGNKAYEQENGTYGLTTLKRKHLKKNGNNIAFQFKAKGGIWRNTQIKGRRLTRLILECSELPGQEVFQYLDADGIPHPIFSQDVNAYLQEITEGDYTAKDFRTWRGTVGAIELLPDALVEHETFPKRNFATMLVRKVAEKLGNTVTVCRAHYIHPAMLSITTLPRTAVEEIIQTPPKKYEDLETHLSEAELKALFLIENQS